MTSRDTRVEKLDGLRSNTYLRIASLDNIFRGVAQFMLRYETRNHTNDIIIIFVVFVFDFVVVVFVFDVFVFGFCW